MFQQKRNTKKKTPMDAALTYLEYQARTVREVERYLDKKEYGEMEIQQVIERLKELSYLDDAAFAAQFVRTRLATKPISRQHLREQLMHHEIEKDVIDEALNAVDDQVEYKNAKEIAQKFIRQFQGLEPGIKKQRVTQRLQSRGYSFSCIREVLNDLQEDIDSEEFCNDEV